MSLIPALGFVEYRYNMEIWKDIAGYEGYYSVSNNGKILSIRKKKLLASRIGNTGYVSVHLSIRGKSKRYSIHRLVAKAFIENPNNLPQVNHKDGIKTNNCVENLEWITCVENLKHSYKIRLENMTITEEIVRKVYLDFHKHCIPVVKLIKKYSLGLGCISEIVRNKSWKNVTEPLRPLLPLPSDVVIINGEEWKDIDGYLGRYRISSDGRVFSIRANRYLKPHLSRPNGRFTVGLSLNGIDKNIFIHRLVAEHFIPNPNKFTIVHHIDHDRLNNNVSNLQWCNQSYNMKQASDAGKISRQKGEKHWASKLTPEEVLAIRSRYSNGGTSYNRLAKEYKVCGDTIRQIVKRHIWKHI